MTIQEQSPSLISDPKKLRNLKSTTDEQTYRTRLKSITENFFISPLWYSELKKRFNITVLVSKREAN